MKYLINPAEVILVVIFLVVNVGLGAYLGKIVNYCLYTYRQGVLSGYRRSEIIRFGDSGKTRNDITIKECLIYAMLLANPVQNGSSDASDVQFWSEFW